MAATRPLNHRAIVPAAQKDCRRCMDWQSRRGGVSMGTLSDCAAMFTYVGGFSSFQASPDEEDWPLVTVPLSDSKQVQAICRQFAKIIRAPEESRMQLTPYAPISRVVTFAPDSLFPSSLRKAVLRTPLNAKPSDLTFFPRRAGPHIASLDDSIH